MATASQGWLTVARVRGVALRVHVLVPVVVLLVAWALRSVAVLAGVLVIILVHELGHAALARRYRLPVLAIDVTPIGGVCRYSNARATETQESVVAWGGVLAQGVLVAIGEIVARTVGLSETLGGIHAFNFVILVLNLLPVRPFDGATAWKLFRWKNLRRLGRRGTLRVRAAGIERRIEREKKKWLN